MLPKVIEFRLSKNNRFYNKLREETIKANKDLSFNFVGDYRNKTDTKPESKNIIIDQSNSDFRSIYEVEKYVNTKNLNGGVTNNSPPHISPNNDEKQSENSAKNVDGCIDLSEKGEREQTNPFDSEVASETLPVLVAKENPEDSISMNLDFRGHDSIYSRENSDTKGSTPRSQEMTPRSDTMRSERSIFTPRSTEKDDDTPMSNVSSNSVSHQGNEYVSEHKRIWDSKQDFSPQMSIEEISLTKENVQRLSSRKTPGKTKDNVWITKDNTLRSKDSTWVIEETSPRGREDTSWIKRQSDQEENNKQCTSRGKEDTSWISKTNVGASKEDFPPTESKISHVVKNISPRNDQDQVLFSWKSNEDATSDVTPRSVRTTPRSVRSEDLRKDWKVRGQNYKHEKSKHANDLAFGFPLPLDDSFSGSNTSERVRLAIEQANQVNEQQQLMEENTSGIPLKICCACEKKVKPHEQYLQGSKVWHRYCMKCVVCGKNLQNLEKKEDSEGELHCFGCFLSNYGKETASWR